MPLFKRKTKLSVNECCTQFYDQHIFNTVIGGKPLDCWTFFVDNAFKLIADIDQSFTTVDRTVFFNEVTALRIEMFALAWSRD